ncbi:MAG: hypothetical protein J6R28_06410 [Bacteroides sp.]|nr:hypothetical protein [Bacteroides sp.]
MKIALISCVSQKQKLAEGELVQAKCLYTSPLFIKAHAYAQQLGVDKIYILSAKHGLLEEYDKIGWYNETLLNKSAKECKDWANSVLDELKGKGHDLSKDTFCLLAGKKYYQYLIGEGKIEKAEYPYHGLKGIGYILSFLKSKIK